MTAGFVGADLANIINEAALLGVRQNRDKVGIAELQEAVERVVAGLEKKNRVLSPDEKKRVAYHELGHALVATALPGNDNVHKISIIPRGVAALGYTMQLPTEDRFLMTGERAGEPGGDAAGRPRRRGADLRRGLDRRARRPEQGDRHRAQHGQDRSA
jgi:ATP-dependent Zn protease